MQRLLWMLSLALWAGAGLAQDDFFDGVRVQDSSPGIADLFVYDATVLDGKLCVGEGCLRSEVFDANTAIVLKSDSNVIDFVDTSTGPSDATTHWQIRPNEPGAHGANWFAIRNGTDGQIPFKIWNTAPESRLTLSSNGVGIGTQAPQGDLHIIAGSSPLIRLEQDGSDGKTPYAWDRYVGADGSLLIWDRTGTERRMVFHPATVEQMQTLEVMGDGSLLLTDDGGSVFLAADAPLHLSREDGNTRMLIEERSTTVSPRTMLNLQNNGRPEMVFGNSSTNGEWSFGAGTNFVLKQGTVGSLSSAKTKVFTLKPNGDLEIEGTLTTMGGTCGGGCDRVFAADYKLPTIKAHAAEMFAKGYLPNIGPTLENTPINVSDKLGRMLNELEHAHIYIAELEGEVSALRKSQAAILARLEALEK